MFEAILDAIKTHDTIILHRHQKPDGDALGSQIGMKHLILANFPDKTVHMVGDAAGRYAFMADSAMEEIPDSVYHEALAIVLDCGGAGLICDERWQSAKTTVRMDHHLFSGKIADIEVIDSSYESCCGLVTSLAEECGWVLNLEAATALYTGMVTDSGRFRYDAVSSRTLHLASLLMTQPIDANELYRNLYATDFQQTLLRAQFTLTIRFTEHRVAYVYTDRDTAASYGIDDFSLSRGMVNTMADIRGVDIWVNFTETEQGVLCELRSSRFNINPVAVKYGGGGHAKASGATLKSREEAMSMLSDLDEMMKGTN